jgi:U3 small nucleolar RNA-associated protein 13
MADFIYPVGYNEPEDGKISQEVSLEKVGIFSEMSRLNFIESVESLGISKAFYTGGLVRVGNMSGLIYSLYNGGVSVVDPCTGQTYAMIQSENDPVFTFAVNPKNNTELVTIGKSNLLRHWLISCSRETSLVRAWSSGHLHPALCVDISHDGSMVATSSVDKTIRVFSMYGYYSVCVYRVQIQDPLSIIRFFPNRLALASLGEDNSVSLWDLNQTSLIAPVRVLDGHMSTIHAIAFSPDGNTMVTSGNDQVVITWNIGSFPNISMASQVAVFESVNSVLPLSASSFITAGDKGQLRIWNDRKCVCTIDSGHSANGHLKYVYQLAKSHEILAIGDDLAMSLWSEPKPAVSFIRQLLGNIGEVLSAKWFPDNSGRIVCAANDEFPRIINTNNFSAEAKLVGHTDICLAVAVSNKGDFVATGGKDQTVRLWYTKTFECVSVMSGHTGPVTAVAFTRKEEGEGIRVISASEDSCVKVWRTPKKSSPSKKSIIRSIMAHSKAVNGLAVSGNDKWLATCSQDRTAKVFSLEDGSLVATCSGHKGTIWSVDFSPIEQIIATSSRDGTIKLWNLSVGGTPCIRTFEGHEQSVMSCRFLSSGLQLVSADSIGTIRVWNVRNGECGLIAMTTGETITHSAVGSRKAQASKIESALEDFSQDESSSKIWTMDITENDKLKIVTGTGNGTINVWIDNTEEITETRRKDKADSIEKDTSIQVLIKAGRFNDAFRSAFDLGRPKQMIEVVKEANWREGRINIPKFVRDNIVDGASRGKLIGMIEEWQKTAKNCSFAYSLVGSMMRISDVSEESNLDLTKFEGFAEKHMNRLSGLSQKCFIIDAILLASDASIEPNKKLRVE